MARVLFASGPSAPAPAQEERGELLSYDRRLSELAGCAAVGASAAGRSRSSKEHPH